MRTSPRPTALLLLALTACDGPRARQDLAFYQDAGADAADDTRDAGGSTDASTPPSLDARAPSDGPRPAFEAGTDSARPADDAFAADARFFDTPPADLTVPPDVPTPADAGAPPDSAAPPDAPLASDARAPIDGVIVDPDGPAPPPDQGPLPPDAGPVEPPVLLRGHARAADETLEVEVSVPSLNLRAIASPPDHTFEIGPVPGDAPVGLVFRAEHHAEERVTWRAEAGEPAELDEEVYLYRGVRVAEDPAAERMFLSPDERWVLWHTGDRLSIAPTDASSEARALVPAEFEIYLGMTPDESAAVVRRRNRPGLAGDIDAWPLAGGARQPMFEEAQPWVRWIDHRALAMVHTREALSGLVLAAPGGPSRELAVGVPWLLVTRLASGRIAFAAGEPGGYDIYLHEPDGGPEVVSPPGAASGDTFLSTSPDGRRLYWRTPEATLWLYDEDSGASVRLAEDVAASPRPSPLGGGGVIFWRSEAAGHDDLFFLPAPGAEERLLARDVDGRTYYPTPDGYFVTAPGRGLLHGLRAGPEGQVVLPGERVQFLARGTGVAALVDGVPFAFTPGEAPVRHDGAGLSALEMAPRGATAWDAARSELVWFPGPGERGATVVLSRGAAQPNRITEPARDALYVREDGPWRRVGVPDGEVDVVFDRATDTVLPVDADRALGRDPEATLWQLGVLGGESVAWARHVTQLDRGLRRTFVAYVADRGVFVVPVADLPSP